MRESQKLRLMRVDLQNISIEHEDLASRLDPHIEELEEIEHALKIKEILLTHFLGEESD